MNKQIRRTVILASLMGLLLVVAASRVTADDPEQFGPWSAPVNLGPPVNTVGTDFQPFISKDGLSLYFVRLEGNVLGGPQDIWVAKRDSETEPWGTPEKLDPGINSAANENNPFVTIDGHWMYFGSTRTTPDANGVLPFGRSDIYVSHRQNKREDFGPAGWQEPVNLGSGVNTAFQEAGPIVFEDDLTGVTTLYFDSGRPGLGGLDIYVSTLQPDGTFGPAVLVTELSSPYTDQQPSISRDGLEMYFISNRPGSTIGPDGQPSLDIWVSTRPSTSDPWGTPQNLDAVNQALGGPAINSPFHDGRPSLSFDGKTLYFFSAFRNAGLPGGNLSVFFDIWQTTREKLKAQN